MNAQNEELQELEELCRSKSSEIVEHNLEIQKITHELEKHQREQHSAQQIVSELESQYDWIADQKQ